MEYNRQRNAQLDYLRFGLPDGFTFSTEYYLGKNIDGVDGIIFFNEDPCALVIYGQNLSSDEQKSNAKQNMRRYGMPYALVFYEDSWRFFLQDDDKIIEKGKLHEFINVIQEIVAENNKTLTINDVALFLKQVMEICQQYNLSDNLRMYISKLEAEDIISKIDVAKFELAWSFQSELEQDFISEIVGKCSESELCRYTTLESLFRMLSEGKVSMCSITCMNDKSECYYVDQYLKNSHPRRISEFSQEEIRILNSFFILSCSDKSLEDNLLMWRMYAKEATGVCINYNIDKEKIKKPYYMAKVNYAQQDGFHPELEFIRDIMNITICGKNFRFKNFSLWKHFFKQYEYRDEQEIRLLYIEPNTSNYKWIKTSDHIICPIVEFGDSDFESFPLTLSKITLGPKTPENDTNVPQIKFLLDCSLIKKNVKTMVGFSKISSYR